MTKENIFIDFSESEDFIKKKSKNFENQQLMTKVFLTSEEFNEKYLSWKEMLTLLENNASWNAIKNIKDSK